MVLDLIASIKRELGQTVLMVGREEAHRRYFGREVRLYDGRLAEEAEGAQNTAGWWGGAEERAAMPPPVRPRMVRQCPFAGRSIPGGADRARFRMYASKSCQTESAATTAPSTMTGVEVTIAR